MITTYFLHLLPFHILHHCPAWGFKTTKKKKKKKAQFTAINQHLTNSGICSGFVTSKRSWQLGFLSCETFLSKRQKKKLIDFVIQLGFCTIGRKKNDAVPSFFVYIDLKKWKRKKMIELRFVITILELMTFVMCWQNFLFFFPPLPAPLPTFFICFFATSTTANQPLKQFVMFAFKRQTKTMSYQNLSLIFS